MAKKNKGKGRGGAAGSSGEPGATAKDAGAPDVVVEAERRYERGDFSGVREVLPRLRAEPSPQAARTAETLWDKVKIDPVLVAVGVGALLVVVVVAMITLA